MRDGRRTFVAESAAAALFDRLDGVGGGSCAAFGAGPGPSSGSAWEETKTGGARSGTAHYRASGAFAGSGACQPSGYWQPGGTAGRLWHLSRGPLRGGRPAGRAVRRHGGHGGGRADRVGNHLSADGELPLGGGQQRSRVDCPAQRQGVPAVPGTGRDHAGSGPA